VGKLEGKVAFITGAARGQGRSHAIRLAQEGADIIACDLCENVASAQYELGTELDLQETVRQVEALDRRIVARPADVRSLAQLEAVVASGLAELGHIDIVLANAGIGVMGSLAETTEAQWDDVIGIDLTGAWKTVKATAPSMIERGSGGAIVLTSSTLGLWGPANCSAYAAAKHGVVGLMRSLSNELAPHSIRVNTVNPTTVDTAVVQNEAMYRLFSPELEDPGRDDFAQKSMFMHALPIPWLDPVDVSNAIAWLVSDEARYVTGITLRVDAGTLSK
jgi:(+)-trans-carveol dehydrogenase